MSDDLTAEFIRAILDYDYETGIFRWRAGYWKSVVPGRIAGRVCGKGYASISIASRHRASHRLAWLHYYGEWPAGQIDHMNRDKTDNRISNLRVVSASANCLNRNMRVSRYSNERGVSFLKSRNKWQVQLCVPGDRRPKYIGSYLSKDDAVAAYAAARERLL